MSQLHELKCPRMIFFVSPPGGGKGDQIKLLLAHMGHRVPSLVALPMSGLLRDYAASAEPVERETIHQAIATRTFVSDELTIKVFTAALVKAVKTGCHIAPDGFPRTVIQARALMSEPLVALISGYRKSVCRIDTPLPACQVRLLGGPEQAGRGRNDDTPKGVAKGFEDYLTDTMPAGRYLGKYMPIIRVNGNRPQGEVHEDILEQLGW